VNAPPLQSLLLLAALALPLLAALALTIASWRETVMRATPLAAVPALLLVLAGQNGASLHLPLLAQHAILGVDAVGRIFLGFTSVLWLATWPLLVGGGLAMLGAWLRRWFSGDLTRWLPAGDLGVLLERPLARVQLRMSDRPVPDHAHGHGGGSDEEDLRGPARLAAVGGHLAGIEHTLRAWPVTGAALLLLIGVILWLLTH
jgi:hypothetical protein